MVFGTAAGFAASLDLAALDGSNGFRLDGIDDGDYSGFSVAGAGDVNGDGIDSGTSVAGAGDISGDGIDDLIIGAPDAGAYAGASFVAFGTDAGFRVSGTSALWLIALASLLSTWRRAFTPVRNGRARWLSSTARICSGSPPPPPALHRPWRSFLNHGVKFV